MTNKFNLKDFYNIFDKNNNYIIKDYINSDGTITTNDDLTLLATNYKLEFLMKILIFNNKYITNSANTNTKIILNEDKKYNYADFSLNTPNNLFNISNTNFDCNYYTSQTIIKYSFLLDVLIQIFKSPLNKSDFVIYLNYYKNSAYYTKNVFYSFTIYIDDKLNIIINNLSTSDITYNDLKELFTLFETDIVKHLYFIQQNKQFSQYYQNISIYYNTIKLMLNNVILSQINFILFKNILASNTLINFNLFIDNSMQLLITDTNYSKLLKIKKEIPDTGVKFKYYVNNNTTLIDCNDNDIINFSINSQNTVYVTMYKPDEYVSDQIIRNIKYYTSDYTSNNITITINQQTNAVESINNLELNTTYYFKLNNFSTIYNNTNINQNINNLTDNFYWDNANKFLKIYSGTQTNYILPLTTKIYMIVLNTATLTKLAPFITGTNKTINILNTNTLYKTNLTTKINTAVSALISDKISFNPSTNLITILDISANFGTFFTGFDYLSDNFTYVNNNSKIAFLCYGDLLDFNLNNFNPNFFNNYFSITNGIIKPVSFEITKKNKYYDLNNKILADCLNNITIETNNYNNVQVKNNVIIDNVNNIHQNSKYNRRDEIIIKNSDIDYLNGNYNYLSISYIEIYVIIMFVTVITVSVFLFIFNNNFLISLLSLIMCYFLFVVFKLLNTKIKFTILPIFLSFIIVLSMIFTLFFGINILTRFFIVVELFILIIIIIITSFNIENFDIVNANSNINSNTINDEVKNEIIFNDKFIIIFKNLTANMILNNANITSDLLTPIIKKENTYYNKLHHDHHILAVEKINYLNKYNEGSYNLLANRVNYLLITGITLTFVLFIYGLFKKNIK